VRAPTSLGSSEHFARAQYLSLKDGSEFLSVPDARQMVDRVQERIGRGAPNADARWRRGPSAGPVERPDIRETPCPPDHGSGGPQGLDPLVDLLGLREAPHTIGDLPSMWGVISARELAAHPCMALRRFTLPIDKTRCPEEPDRVESLESDRSEAMHETPA
jgi:hypothetical protein